MYIVYIYKSIVDGHVSCEGRWGVEAGRVGFPPERKVTEKLRVPAQGVVQIIVLA